MSATNSKLEAETDTNSTESFDLQKYLCSKDGNEWLKEVKVEDANKKSFRYYAPPVAWEDINRHDNSTYGDFIFDVTIKMKNKDNKPKSNKIRYVLRPENMRDPISLRSTKSINIPIGNYNGNKLKNVKLIDLLSKKELLSDIGLNCQLSGSLYEPLLDEPSHCLPDINCICGESLQRMIANEAYSNRNVYCDVCKTETNPKPINGNNIIYHCPKGKTVKIHEHGYDICEQCVGLQVRTFIDRDNNKNNKDKDNDIKMNETSNSNISKEKEKENKFGKGGMMLSVGCGLMSENDMGNSYSIEVYLHKSFKYKYGKCLCIISTSEGSTANIIEQGKISILKFGKNKKECDWGIQKFDTSTQEGKINERTGKSAETDMIIYFIPVQEHRPPTKPRYEKRRKYRNSTPFYKRGYGIRGRGRGISQSKCYNDYNYNNNNKRSRSRSRDRDRDRCFKSINVKRYSRSRSRSRSRSSSSDSDSDSESEESMQLKFAKHKMTVSDRDFNGLKLKYPLKRIRELPIRSFLRGAVFFDQRRKPDESDAKRLSNYLQSRYNDSELLSIHSYCVLIKQRAKLLPISDEYYKNLNKCRNEIKNKDGIYDFHFTEYAKANNETCVVCMDNFIDSIMVDCYHMCLCTECGIEWKMSCPICRTKVKKIVKENELDKNNVKIIPMAVSD